MAQRDDFSAAVKQSLALRVGNLCSRPGCRALTSGPHEQADKAVNLGVAAHITAAARGGPRFDPGLTPEARAGAENGIWLCQNCAKLIDSDVERFPVASLLEWKTDAEGAARSRLGKSDESDDRLPRADQARPRGERCSLIALGPNVVAEGERIGGGGGHWTLRIYRFLLGDDSALGQVGNRYAHVAPDEHFVVLSEPAEARAVTNSVSWKWEGAYCELQVPVALPQPRRPVKYLESLDVDTMLEVRGVPAGATTLHIWLGTAAGGWNGQDRVGSWMAHWWRVASLLQHRSELLRMEIVRLANVPRVMNNYTGEFFAPLDFVERVVSITLLPNEQEEDYVWAEIEVLMAGGGPWKGRVAIATEPPMSMDEFMARALHGAAGT